MKPLVISLLLALPLGLLAGPYTAAEDGSQGQAVAMDDPALIGWATAVADFAPGPVQIDSPELGLATYGLPSAALGAAEGTAYGVVSLGDGGSITVTFAQPISDEDGWDFAVFENGFYQYDIYYFCELAFVEVSSDGINFFRFPTISLTDPSTQIASFEGIDPTDIQGLAGTQPQGWGTTFDLSVLNGISPLLDVHAITHVRIIDVIGDIDSRYASYDSLGNIINDPWPTPFGTSGFDLDAVGVRHFATNAEPRGFEAWRSTQFDSGQLSDSSFSGSSADPDHDGLCNLLEYALGTSPTNPEDRASPLEIDWSANVASSPVLSNRADLQYTLESSENLIIWTTSPEIGTFDPKSNRLIFPLGETTHQSRSFYRLSISRTK